MCHGTQARPSAAPQIRCVIQRTVKTSTSPPNYSFSSSEDVGMHHSFFLACYLYANCEGCVVSKLEYPLTTSTPISTALSSLPGLCVQAAPGRSEPVTSVTRRSKEITLNTKTKQAATLAKGQQIINADEV
ncbi:hypothetical protein TraAM80_01021 [Trypanosoma rangeli]|uniref:Uncharacterized protein n=1 Tax=Trypanosoma rangeli TaxID=5698 RepID=A0A3R7P1W0_TRYRA|nr:uncharacterized protein TraAM80_01021 [Trypanosoma rangeli]RNF11403.1 hypothetical protein TraAM80_01021 [Trypanosoma rangeli]|eukprot:RNF11403.1 hypothetical protein TraAM80_01021 [Trypanosoma rangeli]